MGALRLEQWNAVFQPGRGAPEVIHGLIYGDPHMQNGTAVSVYNIVRWSDTAAVTKSGRRIALGKRKAA